MQHNISVAMCTHNGQAHFKEQLHSILNQSVTVQEICIYDDASEPQFRDLILEEIRISKKQFPEVTFRTKFNNPALGIAKNFESAIQACLGNIIFLSDQDDIWVPTKVERVSNYFDQNPQHSLVFTDARLVDEDGIPLKKTLFETLYISPSELNEIIDNKSILTLARRNIVTGATVALKSGLREVAGQIPEGWIHDEWYAMVAAMRAELGLLPTELIDYRQHGGNQIGVKSLSLRGKLGRLRVSRGNWNARLLRRAQSLSDWVISQGYPVQDIQTLVAQAKVAHELVRNGYPKSRLRRPIHILREIKTGRYKSCGLGIQDIVRDLVQPV
jgi:glycosyltransferase involved in cell wall biosynthesis